MEGKKMRSQGEGERGQGEGEGKEGRGRRGEKGEEGGRRGRTMYSYGQMDLFSFNPSICLFLFVRAFCYVFAYSFLTLKMECSNLHQPLSLPGKLSVH